MSEHTVAEAEKNLAELVDRSLRGETVVLTRDGKPVVELRPVPQPTRGRIMGPQDWDRLYSSLPKSSYTGTIDGAALIREMRDEGP